jgi:hypothetical protein
MALTGLTFTPLDTYGIERILIAGKFAIGSTGAVGTCSFGFAGTANLPYKGSVVRTDVGDYTITLPGRGSVQSIIMLGEPVLEVNGNDLFVKVVAIDPSDRTIDLTCTTLDGTPLVGEAASGDTLHFACLVVNSNVE